MATALAYGAYGHTGELVAREAVAAGLEPTLAGRRREPLVDLARDLGLDFAVSDLEGLEATLAETDADLLVHCAGPFVDTYEPAVAACPATGTHYLDITGEVPAIEGSRRVTRPPTRPACCSCRVPGSTWYHRTVSSHACTNGSPGRTD